MNRLAIIVFCLLVSVPVYGQVTWPEHRGDMRGVGITSGGGAFVGDLFMTGDICIYFGGTEILPLYAWCYQAGTTEFHMWSTNCDGGGTDCFPISVDDGTDDLDLTGILTIDGAYIRMVNANLNRIDMGATGQVILQLSSPIDQFGLFVGDDGGRQFVFSDFDFQNTDHDHPLQTHPTLFVHGYFNPNTDNGYYTAQTYASILSGTPETDRAANPYTVKSGNAWTQAAAGVTRNGADTHVRAGIRTLQILCNNFAWANLDEVQFTINGVVQAALIEGTQWNAGINDAATCVNVGAAITTAAYGITVDCATTPATCYLELDENLMSINSITITDGGVDGVFAQIVEGVDGSVYPSDFFRVTTQSSFGGPAILAAIPAEPHVCDAAHEGLQLYIDDTNDTAYGRLCICANLDGTGYDWRDVGDIVGTACPFF